MSKFLTALVAVYTLGLSGCGFALRGTTDSFQIAPQYQTVELVTIDSQEALHLKRAITKHLTYMHLQTGISTNQIRVDDLRFRRYELVGTLTEIRLVLVADVSITIDGRTITAPMQVEQSYQHNEASVVTFDQQGEETKEWLYDQLAERIAERYRAMARQ